MHSQVEPWAPARVLRGTRRLLPIEGGYAYQVRLHIRPRIAREAVGAAVGACSWAICRTQASAGTLGCAPARGATCILAA